MTESTPYKCVNCFLGLTSMQTWKFAHASPLCVSCYDSLCEQKRGKQPEPLADCIAANLALPRYYGKQPAVLPETLPAGLVIKVAGIEIRLLEPARLIARGCAYDCPARAVKCEGDKAEEVLSRCDGAVIPLGWLDWATVPIQKVKPAMMGRCLEVFSPSASCELSPGHAGPHHCGNLRWVTDSEQARFNPSRCVVSIGEVTLESPATCRDCSSPATSYGTRCKYCEHRAECEPIGDDAHNSIENREARARMLAADERERPKVSATSREMAKAHPWVTDENEPE